MAARVASFVVVLAASAACRDRAAHHEPARADAVARPDALADALPEVAGDFRGGPLERGAGFARRDYARGDGARVDVTVARYGDAPAQYARWVAMSAGYPAASLDVPEGTGSGFFDCGADGGPCALHVQLRAGYHVECMGSGGTTREDLAELARALPLRRLAGG